MILKYECVFIPYLYMKTKHKKHAFPFHLGAKQIVNKFYSQNI